MPEISCNQIFLLIYRSQLISFRINLPKFPKFPVDAKMKAFQSILMETMKARMIANQQDLMELNHPPIKLSPTDLTRLPQSTIKKSPILQIFRSTATGSGRDSRSIIHQGCQMVKMLLGTSLQGSQAINLTITSEWEIVFWQSGRVLLTTI